MIVFQVTCSECNFVSVMHEPFMYLSVPLPYATQQQMCKSNTIHTIRLKYYYVFMYYFFSCNFR